MAELRMHQINVANLPCEETTVSCRIVKTAVSDVAGMWHGMADMSAHLVTVLACTVSEGCVLCAYRTVDYYPRAPPLCVVPSGRPHACRAAVDVRSGSRRGNKIHG